jgi:large subunit ribosomal protein L20
MPRARGRVPAHARHRKVIKAAKGFYGRRKNTFRTAQAAVVKAGVNAYKGRKQKKRNFRSLWIQRINAACRVIDESFIFAFHRWLSEAGITVDHKVMADHRHHEPQRSPWWRRPGRRWQWDGLSKPISISSDRMRGAELGPCALNVQRTVLI